MDLGSALMSTEFAVELLGDTPGPVVLSEAPLVEGTVAAAAAARGGASLDEVAAEARGALAMKTSQLGGGDEVRRCARAGAGRAAGRRARPCSRSATRSVSTRGRRRDSSRPSGGSTPTCGWQRRPDGAPVKATSLTNVVALGARFGDTLVGHRVGAAGGRGVGGAGAAGRRGVRRRRGRERAAATRPPPRPEQPPRRAAAAPATESRRRQPATSSPAFPPPPDWPSARLTTRTAPSSRRRTASPTTPDRERERLSEGIAAARTAIERDRETVASRAGKAEAAIFDAHLALLDDEAMLEPAQQAIDGGATAERAWYDAAAAGRRAATAPSTSRCCRSARPTCSTSAGGW